jgi:hypothetical protein
MFAISHAATALLIKRRFPEAPLGGLLVSVQLLEILWLILNVAGVEDGRAYMPFSHSVASSVAIGLAAWLLMEKVFRRRAVAVAFAIGIGSHLILDLVLHSQAIVLAPSLTAVYLGLGLNGMPPLAISAGIAYGVLCWLVFGGSKALLAVIVFFNLATLSFLQSPHADEPALLLAAAAIEIVVTLPLVWYFSRERAAELEHPSRRLARAFA